MQRTKIEWCDYTINPVKGLCPVACEYCYARRMYKRFYWDETIRLDVMCFLPLLNRMRPPCRVFVGSTMELFGPWVEPEWMEFIFSRVRVLPEHTFIFLTKCPQELARYNPWPRNCWVGVTVESSQHAIDRHASSLREVDAPVRFLSAEPILGEFQGTFPWNVKWLIVGARTQPLQLPLRQSVDNLIAEADKLHVAVFMKNSLAPLYPEGLRQEWPKCE